MPLLFLTPTTGGQNVEMDEYSDRNAGMSAADIRNDCITIEREIDQLDGQLSDLDRVFRQSLSRPDMPSHEIDNLSAQIMATYRGLVSRMKFLKSKREASNPQCANHVSKADRRLKQTIQKYQTLESTFRKESQQAAERQYRIVRPDATDAEVREAVSDPNAPIFQQAVSNSTMK